MTWYHVIISLHFNLPSFKTGQSQNYPSVIGLKRKKVKYKKCIIVIFDSSYTPLAFGGKSKICNTTSRIQNELGQTFWAYAAYDAIEDGIQRTILRNRWLSVFAGLRWYTTGSNTLSRSVCINLSNMKQVDNYENLYHQQIIYIWNNWRMVYKEILKCFVKQ